LLATEIALRRQNRSMAKQELNLLQFPSAGVTKLGAGAPKIMRRKMFNPKALCTITNDIPDDVLGYPLNPG